MLGRDNLCPEALSRWNGAILFFFYYRLTLIFLGWPVALDLLRVVWSSHLGQCAAWVFRDFVILLVGLIATVLVLGVENANWLFCSDASGTVV